MAEDSVLEEEGEPEEDDELRNALDDAFGDWEEEEGGHSAEPAQEGQTPPDLDQDVLMEPTHARKQLRFENRDEDAEPGTQEHADMQAAGAAGAQAGRQPEAQTSEDAEMKKRIMSAMTDEQLNRYESFRRSSLTRPKVKKLLTTLLGYQVPDKAVIAVCGVSKIFIGELIETARMLASDGGHQGPLLPKHIHAAYQSLHKDCKIPRRQPPKRLFKM